MLRLSLRRRDMRILLLAVLLLQSSSQAQALALRGPFPMMFLNDIFVGRTPSAAQARDRLRVANTGQDPIGVVMQLEPTRPDELRDGYDPLPNMSWITLAPPRFSLEPGEEGVSAILVSIPNDPSLQGAQFQLAWSAVATVPSTGAQLLPRSQVFVTVQLNASTTIIQSVRSAGLAASQAPNSTPFTLSPPSGRADNVALGRKVDLRELGLALKLGNPNSQEAEFSVLSACDNASGSDNDFKCAPNPNFLRAAASSVKVAANSVAEADFYLEIPNQLRYQGRKWAFVVKAAPLGGAQGDVKTFRLLVTTQRAGGK